MKHRFKRWVLLAGAILTLPPFLLTLIFVFNVVNPMAVSFLTPFEVVNETEEPLRITPIGARGSQGTRGTLPYSISMWLYLMSTKHGDFLIPPGSSRRFIYDFDDVQFSEILILRETGSYHFISTGLHPIEGQYRVPDQDRFVINGLEALPTADETLLSALSDKTDGGWRFYAFLASGLLCPFFVFLVRKARRE